MQMNGELDDNGRMSTLWLIKPIFVIMGVYLQIVRTIDNCELVSDGNPPQKKRYPQLVMGPKKSAHY